MIPLTVEQAERKAEGRLADLYRLHAREGMRRGNGEVVGLPRTRRVARGGRAMNPIEQEVREMLHSKVRRAPGHDEPTPEILRRARTRRAFTVGGTILAAAAVIVGAFVVV